MENFPNISSWRLKGQRYRLRGDICDKTHPSFPPDDVCKQCNPNEAISSAIARSITRTRNETAEIKAKIAIYEANPDKYQSLDEINVS